MYSDAEPKPLRINQLLDQAGELLHSQGVSPETLDPKLVVLATNRHTDVQNAAQEAIVQGFLYDENITLDQGLDTLLERNPDPRLARGVSEAQDITSLSFELARGARRRARVVAAAAGVALASWFLAGIGETKYDIATNNSDGPVLGDQLLENNHLVMDSSIMPGEIGHDIPGIGIILQNIPGIPDYGRYKHVVDTPDPASETLSESPKTVLVDGMQGEGIFAVISLPILLVGGYLIPAARAHGRSVRRKAQKLVKKAGIQL